MQHIILAAVVTRKHNGSGDSIHIQRRVLAGTAAEQRDLNMMHPTYYHPDSSKHTMAQNRSTSLCRPGLKNRHWRRQE